MLNLWYDFDTGARWTPYTGLGIGFMRADFGGVKYDANAIIAHTAKTLMGAEPGLLQDPSQAALGRQIWQQLEQSGLANLQAPALSTTDTALAWQVGFGASHRLNDTTSINVGYRFQNTDTMEFSGRNAAMTVNSQSKISLHLVEIGVRYDF
ncbi:MAG: outer membrane beta-barrel protein [Gammaproteobacteria bacterium]|nr:outer membrane beta-barrel protein [Gammaproteobacteria bacterium]MYJ51151.1 outer membrane beta-barrel protein [Gammaproteobacteria bacterium]